MNLRLLGRTGLRVSEIGFGCGPTAGLMIRSGESERREAIACALDHGINYFDTAPGYGNAASERNLGLTLRELGAAPIIASKVALDITQLDDIGRAIESSVEKSLRRLQVGELSVIQLHNRVAGQRAAQALFGTGAVLSLNDVLGPGGVVDAFEQLRARGLVRFFGCTAFGGDMSVVQHVIDSGSFDVMTGHYSLLNVSAWTPHVAGSEPEEGHNYAGMGARAAARNMGIIGLRVLEGGVLTTAPSDETARVVEQRTGFDPRCSAMELSEMGIRFALANPELSTVLVGFSNRQQIEASVRFSRRGPLRRVAAADVSSPPLNSLRLQ
jgi:aryl-alcohol dehydrogenase-like predicted oxidoreductase